MSLYANLSARDLRKEERQLMSILRTGKLLNSEQPVLADRAAIAERLSVIRFDRLRLRTVGAAR